MREGGGPLTGGEGPLPKLYIRRNLTHNRTGITLTGNYNLFFENLLVAVTNDAWNATFADHLVKNALFLVLGVTATDFNGKFLLVYFLSGALESYFDCLGASRRDRPDAGVYGPLVET